MNVEGADDWNVGMQVVISLIYGNLFIASHFVEGLCMRKLNVSAIDTRDPDGRLRFMPWKLDHLLTGSWSQRRLAQFKYPMASISINLSLKFID